MTQDPDVGEGQLALPLTLPQSEPGGAGTPIWAWLRSFRLGGQAAAGFLSVVGRAGRVLTRFLVRWGLRIGLPLLGVTVMLRSFPYQTDLLGVRLRIQGTLWQRSGLSVDTNLGNWEFPTVDGLPFGVHVSPQNVDVLGLNQAAAGDMAAYAHRLQQGAVDELPHVILWLLGETVLGLILGLAGAAALNMAGSYLRGRIRRPDELRHRARQLLAAGVVTIVAVGYAAVSYNPAWAKQSELTGTLAAAQLFPDQLSAYYQKSKVEAVLGSIVGIQGALQDTIEPQNTPETAVRIMFISDVHLAAVYPLVKQYAANYQVDLIINTGDESEFATKAELTPDYISSLTSLTAQTPMLWVGGNHDSPDVEQVMASVPGVTVLGSTRAVANGFTVTAGQVDAFGLRIGGVPDPRVYGGPGAYGSNTKSVTEPLVRSSVDTAVPSARESHQPFDIFAAHEPVATRELREALPGQIRQTNAGHMHAQNAADDIQSEAGIDLVEGSTGAGGLDNIVRGVDQPPIEFSIESVAQNCQFTRVLRFQIQAQQVVDESQPPAYGDDVAVSTVYFKPQSIDADRTCGPTPGVGTARPL